MQREQPVRKLWGSTEPGVLEERGGGLCGWSRLGKEEEGGREGQEGDRGGQAGSWGQKRGLVLLPQGDGSPGGLWGRDGEGSRVPSGVIVGSRPEARVDGPRVRQLHWSR